MESSLLFDPLTILQLQLASVLSTKLISTTMSTLRVGSKRLAQIVANGTRRQEDGIVNSKNDSIAPCRTNLDGSTRRRVYYLV